MVAGAAARRLFASGRQIGDPLCKGVPQMNGKIRRLGSQSGDGKEEIEKFVINFKNFLKSVEASGSQEEFSSLMTDLTSSMSNIAKNGIMYPTELANLVATHVPVKGKYVPHDSKLVIMDFAKRLEEVERISSWKREAIIGVLTLFVGTVLTMPVSFYKLKVNDNEHSERLNKLEEKEKDTPEKLSKLEAEAAAVPELIQKQEALEKSVPCFKSLEKRVSALEVISVDAPCRTELKALDQRVTDLENNRGLDLVELAAEASASQDDKSGNFDLWVMVAGLIFILLK